MGAVLDDCLFLPTNYISIPVVQLEFSLYFLSGAIFKIPVTLTIFFICEDNSIHSSETCQCSKTPQRNVSSCFIEFFYSVSQIYHPQLTRTREGIASVLGGRHKLLCFGMAV